MFKATREIILEDGQIIAEGALVEKPAAQFLKKGWIVKVSEGDESDEVIVETTSEELLTEDSGDADVTVETEEESED